MKGDSITKKNTGLFDNNPVFACLCYFNFQNNLLIRVPIRIGVTHRQWVVSCVRALLVNAYPTARTACALRVSVGGRRSSHERS